MKTRSARVGLVAVLAVFTQALSLASVRPDSEEEKIAWLITQVRESPAVFLRNGSEYDGNHAASHLEWKLRWAGKRVQTAGQFIEGVASRSEQTSKVYEIRLEDGRTMPLGDWLEERLATREGKTKVPSAQGGG